MNYTFFTKSKVEKRLLVAVIVALAVYILGVRWPLIAVLVGLLVYRLPLPSLFASVVSRIVASIFVFMSIVQVAAVFQYVALPNSSYVTLAIITTCLTLSILWFARRLVPGHESSPSMKRLWRSADVFVVAIAVVAFLPFLPIYGGSNSYARIAEIGGIQAIDGINHYLNISEQTSVQHLDYRPNYYYPKGFHLAYAFIQESLLGRPSTLGWDKNALLYMTQYLLMMGGLIFSVYYLTIALVRRFSKDHVIALRQHVAATITIAPILTLFYLIPFVTNGFLNYYYVIAAFALGAAIAIDPHDRKTNQHWKMYSLVLFALVTFGAGMSWPLLIPLLGFVVIVAMAPSRLHDIKKLLRHHTWAIAGVVALLVIDLLLIYYQVAFADPDPTKGINATGSLNAFHLLVHIAAVVAIAVIALHKRIDQDTKEMALSVYVPVIGLVWLLAMFQYITTGEIRYYVAKLSIVSEIIMIALFAAAVGKAVREVPLKVMILLLPLPVMAASLLLSYPQDPFKDVRNLFRDASHQSKPDYFDHDVLQATRLGRNGAIARNNIVVLHYDRAKDKIYGHEQIAYWAGGMQYDGSRENFATLMTVGQLYSNLSFGTFSDEEQHRAVALVKDLAKSLGDYSVPLYVVTDEASAPEITRLLGDNNIRIVY